MGKKEKKNEEKVQRRQNPAVNKFDLYGVEVSTPLTDTILESWGQVGITGGSVGKKREPKD
ncbi:hypothetical protein ACFO25_06160 [Paenactinomyces guangxiensis]|uniref:Uncharacterized protein n=1 Tax=Paenactinomyces guangxiensis TaxID=1490290 RepID=A0A7W1WQG3_9BACL|nr:hypothetical protein [Paenactinomyces guangxiensis]MBA4494181.1 hypothetical protein [Paenactinomyces guangxiensis]MBH8590677.1 hypothetical protein [Paenactinomyces guangxiensis]